MKKIFAAALVAASLGAVALPAAAAVVVEIAPPAPRFERVPASRHGFIWVPGHWEWNGHRHFWVNGTWMRERRGYRYVEPSWSQRDGRWALERGRWERGDRDHDGIPNRYDRHDDRKYHRADRDHDGVADRHDRDRDGDGVPNRYDQRPDNPRRN